MNDDKRTFSSAEGFTIAYPRTWRVDSTIDVSVPVKLYIYITASNVIDAVDVATSDLAEDVTLWDFTNSNLEELTSLHDFVLISSEATHCAAHPACKTVWEATVPIQLGSTEGEVRVASIKAMQIFAIRHKKGYVISYKATRDDFDKYLQQAQEVIDSFAFI